MKKRVVSTVISFLLFSFLGVAHAERYIIVNGQRLSIPEIQYLERIHCGPIPNGRYWLNIRTRIWGYEGNPRAQGHIKDNCDKSQRRHESI